MVALMNSHTGIVTPLEVFIIKQINNMLSCADQSWFHETVVGRWVVVGMITTQIIYSRLPENVELAFTISVTNPVKTHDKLCLMTTFINMIDAVL